MKNVNKTPTLNKADGCSNLWHDYPYWHSVIQIKLSDIVHLPLNFNDKTSNHYINLQNTFISQMPSTEKYWIF